MEVRSCYFPAMETLITEDGVPEPMPPKQQFSLVLLSKERKKADDIKIRHIEASRGEIWIVLFRSVGTCLEQLNSAAGRSRKPLCYIKVIRNLKNYYPVHLLSYIYKLFQELLPVRRISRWTPPERYCWISKKYPHYRQHFRSKQGTQAKAPASTKFSVKFSLVMERHSTASSGFYCCDLPLRKGTPFNRNNTSHQFSLHISRKGREPG